MITPERCVGLSIGATVPQVKKTGIGTALTNQGLNTMKKKGYQYCLADWRMTNLESPQFWPSQGFTPLAYRLVRRVDPRIAWVNVST